MRRILAASLLLVPSLIPSAASATQPASDSSDSTPALRISTGVVAPKVLSTTDLALPDAILNHFIPSEATVVLTLNVDEQGKAQDVQVVQSANKMLDERVADAVRKFRFSPAMLDNQAVSSDLKLTVELER
jgi:TonB family protein